MELTRKEKQALTLADELQHRPYYNEILSSSHLRDLGTDLKNLLQLRRDAALALRASLSEHLGSRLDDLLLIRITQKVVFGRELLQIGKHIADYAFEKGSFQLKCTDAFLEIKPFARVRLRFQILSGPLAGTFKDFTCSIFIFQKIGDIAGLASRIWRRFHPRELVGMHFIARLSHGQAGTVRIETLYTNKRLKSRNRRFKNARRHTECKEGVECHYCSKTLSECDRATHTESWSLCDCPAGHQAYSDARGCLFCLEEQFKTAVGIFKFGENDLL